MCRLTVLYRSSWGPTESCQDLWKHEREHDHSLTPRGRSIIAKYRAPTVKVAKAMT
jgi:hypothetical protein